MDQCEEFISILLNLCSSVEAMIIRSRFGITRHASVCSPCWAIWITFERHSFITNIRGSSLPVTIKPFASGIGNRDNACVWWRDTIITSCALNFIPPTILSFRPRSIKLFEFGIFQDWERRMSIQHPTPFNLKSNEQREHRICSDKWVIFSSLTSKTIDGSLGRCHCQTRVRRTRSRSELGNIPSDIAIDRHGSRRSRG